MVRRPHPRAALRTGTILQGIPLQALGLGYYVSGHEMLHYVLESRGIPGPSHHCLFVTPGPDGLSPLEKLVDFLVEHERSHPMVRRFGFEAEKGLDPCRAQGPRAP